ncbi:hypothetical protein AUJ14_05680 [Candidatus Micrarchaeota archaeon CG1_02_55_22]|nr:MAG: hypothetical protein AUJ14_05680 [Candidatus Micrarchaeota archaeon CG1_02_55_22]
MVAVNVNLGAPYEAIVKRLVERGYAGNQTELIRHALVAFERQVDDEEVRLVQKGVMQERELIKSGEMKTIPAARVFKEAGL